MRAHPPPHRSLPPHRQEVFTRQVMAVKAAAEYGRTDPRLLIKTLPDKNTYGLVQIKDKSGVLPQKRGEKTCFCGG